MNPLKAAGLAILLALFCAHPSHATEDLTFHNAASTGYFRVEDFKSNALFWQGNINRGDFFLGVDVNLLLSERKPDNVDTIVLRRLEWDDGTEGILYGPLVDYSLGQGLVLSHFSSLDKDTVLYNNESMALRAYYLGLFDFFDVETFATWAHVYGIRLSEDVYGFTLGQTYVSSAGREDILNGEGKESEVLPQSVAGLDIDAPLFGDFDFRAEAARIRGIGNGYAAGLHWGYNIVAVSISADLQWRKIDPGFAPNYFGSFYETDPVLVGSLESYDKPRQGFYCAIDGAVFNYFNVTFAYEAYDDSNGAFLMDSWLKVFERMRVSAFLKQPTLDSYRPANKEDGQLMGGSIKYDLSPSSYISTTVKKGFNPRIGLPEESALVEFGFIF
jgi:hypothetical protein